MSKKLYNDILKLHKKVEQQSSKNWFILNQFFFAQKIKSIKDKFYNLVKNTGRNTSGFFKTLFLNQNKNKNENKDKNKNRNIYKKIFIS